MQHTPACILFLSIAVILVGRSLFSGGLVICSADAPDAWIHMWAFWRSKYALLGLDHSYLFSHTLSFPGVVREPIAVFDPLLPLLSVPLQFIFADCAIAYNVLVFLGLFFTGLAGYLLGLTFGRGRSTAVVAGVIIAANPFTYRLIAGGYAEYAWWGLLPLSIALYQSYLRQPSRPLLAGYIGSVTALLLMSIYCASYFTVFAAGSLLFSSLHAVRTGRLTRLKRMIRLQLVTLCWLLPLLLFWGYSLSKLAWKNVEWPHPFPTDEVRIYTDLSLSQFSFDACSTPVDAEEAPPSAPDGDMSHWMAWRTLAGSLDASELVDLRRSWTQKYPTETKSQDEAMAYLDESVFAREWLVVALLGCLAFATRRKRRESACYALLGLLFLLLSAGPFLIRGDHIVGLAKLPYAWMYQWVPGFARFIIPARAFLGTVLCAAILAVRGTEVVAGRLCRRSQRDFSPVVSALSIALVVASFALTGYHGYSLPQTETAVPAIYSTIRGEAGRFALLDLPTGGASSRRMHYQSVHNRPVFGGLVAEEWTEQSGTDVVRTNALVLAMEMPAAVENSDAHLDAAANALSQLGFRYLVLHRDGYGRGEEHAAATSTADAVLNTPLFNNGQVSVYRLP